MRKHLLPSIIIICTGLALFIISNYYSNHQTSYSDTLFKSESQNIDKKFIGFLNSVENNVESIQKKFKSKNTFKDTTFIKENLIPFIENDPYLVSIVLLNETNKIGIKKDEKSIVLAIDSTKNLDVVKWQRFENKRLISSWHESFEKEIKSAIWFRELKNTPNQIQWIFRFDLINENDSIKSDSFYAGFSYLVDNVQSLIFLEFSRTKLLNSFSLDKDYNHFNFLIKTNLDTIVNLGTLKKENDSLNISRNNHFKRFEEKNYGIFNFNFKNETYWNSFRKLPKETGIKHYLLTVSENNLLKNNKNKTFYYLNYFALFLIVLGGILFIIKMRKTYLLPNKIMIPTIKEILKEDENRYLEFKSSARWDYRQEKTNPELEKVILKTLAAFGNTDGGILLIGVDDDKNIIGLEKDIKTLKKPTIDYYEVHLRNILHQNMGVKYVSENIRMKFENYSKQKAICIIKVLAADVPLYLKIKNRNGLSEEKFFVRSGNSSQEIKSMSEISDYLNTRFKK